MEFALNRPIFTHEFAFKGIVKEFLGEKSAPTPEEILELIPKDKRLIIGISEKLE